MTEEDTEYIIHCVKHIFDEHIVFQFDCTNTIAEQVLENVTVLMDPSEGVSEGIGLLTVLRAGGIPYTNWSASGRLPIPTVRLKVAVIYPASGSLGRPWQLLLTCVGLSLPHEFAP